MAHNALLRAGAPAIALFLLGAGVAWWLALRLWASVARRSGGIDWLEGLFLALVSVIIVVGWVGVLLATAGLFSIVTIALLLLCGVMVVLWRCPSPVRIAFEAVTWPDIVLLGIVLAVSWVYFQPHEYVLGGTDAGTYVNIGATVARTGQFVLHDDWTAFLAAHQAVTLREQPPIFLTRYLQFLGWYVGDADPARVIPQFFPMHPTLIAVGMQVAGWCGGLYVTPLWSVLGLLSVYLLARRLFDARIALVAVLLLAITPTQIFFSRYPTAEPLTLLLVFTGLLAFQTLWDNDFTDPAWGIMCGAAFGAAFLTRIDLLLLFGLAVFFLTVLGVIGPRARGWWACVITLGIFSLHATLSAFWVNWPYTWNAYGLVLRLFRQNPVLIAIAVFAGVGALVVLVLLPRWSVRYGATLLRWLASPWLRGLCGLVILLASAYAYFLRPIVDPPYFHNAWPSGAQIARLDGLNWVRIGWYLTPLGLLLATLGLAWMCWKEPLLRLGFFLLLGLLTTAQYVYKAFIPSFHIYMMRRYVPMVIPVLVMGMAYALVTLFRWRWYRVGAVLVLIMGASLLLALGCQSRVVLGHRDGAGAVAQVSALADLLQPEAIIIITEPADVLFADLWGVPLHFGFGHDVATVRRDDEQARAFVQRLMQDAEAAQRPVQLIARFPIAEAVRDSLYFEPVAVQSVTLPYLMNTYNAYPTDIQMDTYTIEVYDVALPPLHPVGAQAVAVDIGTLDMAYLAKGFYGKEQLAEALTARWTAGEAVLDVPVGAAGPYEIQIRAASYRPQTLPQADVTISLDGRVLGQFVPDAAWQTFTWVGTAQPIGAVSTLTLTTPTFNPSAMGLSVDDRDLGILMDWVKVTPVDDTP